LVGAKGLREIFRTGIDNLLPLFVEISVNRGSVGKHGVHGRGDCEIRRILEPEAVGEVAST
jgi:hypothetical protein